METARQEKATQTPPRLRLPQPKWLTWLVIACLLVGVGARLRNYFHCPSYWYDEAFLLLNIYERPFVNLLGPLDYNVVIPPFFLWALRGAYLLMGGGEWAMRLPAFGAELLFLAVMIRLARLAVGQSGWIWPVCLAALSIRLLKHGCEVRPYTVDVLFCGTVLLLTASLLRSNGGRAHSRGCALALGGVALVGPWLSFPSVFVLGSASLVVLLVAWRQRGAAWWAFWGSLNVLLGVSLLALWYFSARHLYYLGMIEHWGHNGWGGFPDWANPGSALLWGLSRPAHVGHYATPSMGVPLAILGGLGLVELRRRNQGLLALLLAAPTGFALLAAYLGRYPMADRPTLFLAPCIWLAAACGLEYIRRLAQGRWAFIGLVLPVVVLAPGLASMGKLVLFGTKPLMFREAFQYVRGNLQPGDVLWTSDLEVYRVYYDGDVPVTGCTQAAEVQAFCRGHRVWLVSALSPFNEGGASHPEVFQQLRALGSVEVRRAHFNALDVVLYEPAPAVPKKL